MLANILLVSLLSTNMTGAVLGILAVIIYVLLFMLIVVGLIRLVRFLGTANKEIKLTRMEMGKVAEEVRLLREELKRSQGDCSPSVVT